MGLRLMSVKLLTTCNTTASEVFKFLHISEVLTSYVHFMLCFFLLSLSSAVV